MGRIVHFEIHADDPLRAARFYTEAFGWTVEKWEGPMDYWLVMTGPADQPGIDGGLMKREGPSGGDGVTSFVNTIDVADLDASMAKVEEHGGSIADPKRAVPGVGWMCYAKDTEGNRFGMMQSDESAK
jgi:predicted enzyme related to lactoylglutathione lyase